jgi:SAM-dependent methyltransferase
MMKEIDKRTIIERYNKRLEKFGASIDALASGTEERRRVRFTVLSQIGVSPGDSILDLGCGLGDLWLFFNEKGTDVNYSGIDINPQLIMEARKRYPGVSFDVKDIQTDKLSKVDYVLSTSCFNLTLSRQNNYEFASDILQKSFSLAQKGVAIDFLSDYVDFRGVKEAFYYSPEKMFNIAKKITKRVCIRHDYPLFEFCLYLYPDFTGWRAQ